MTRVALVHRTRYRYDRPVSLGPQLIRLRPAAHARAAIKGYHLAITPEPASLLWQHDAFGNWVARAIIPGEVDKLTIAVTLDAALHPFNPFDFFIEPFAADGPFRYPPDLAADLQPFLAPVAAGARLDALAADFAGWRDGTVALLVALNDAVRGMVRYRERLEEGTHPPEETLARGIGSCRDSAWLLVALLRRLGFAARFVSGYSIQLADGAEVAEDGADLHAWAEAFLPGAGWIGLDPVSGLLTTEGHIPLAATARLAAAAPVEGKIFGEARADFGFDIALRRRDT